MQMSQPIRVVVANRPRLMRELILETIREHADIEIVAEIQNDEEIAETVDATQPDFLIIALEDSDRCPPLCDTLLRRYPEMKVLALAPERNSSMFFWASFDIHATPVEASEAGILGTLRKKVHAAGGQICA
jgi:DNA-binding NarL/FixJ family response regulator